MAEERDVPGLRRLGGVLVAVLTVTALLVAAAPAATALETQADVADGGDGSSAPGGGSGTTFYACAWAIASRPGGGGGGAPRQYVCVQVYPHGDIVRCRYHAGVGVSADAKADPGCEHSPSKSRENSQGVGVSAGTIPGTGVMVWPHCHMPYVHGMECGLNDQYMVGPGS